MKGRMAQRIVLTAVIVAMLAVVPVAASFSDASDMEWSKSRTSFQYEQKSDDLDITVMDPFVNVSGISVFLSSFLGKSITTADILTFFSDIGLNTKDMDITVGQVSSVLDYEVSNEFCITLTGDVSYTLSGSELDKLNSSEYYNGKLLDAILNYFPELTASKSLNVTSTIALSIIMKSDYNYDIAMDKYVQTKQTDEYIIGITTSDVMSVDDKRIVTHGSINSVFDRSIEYSFNSEISVLEKAPTTAFRTTTFSSKHLDADVYGYVDGEKYPLNINTNKIIAYIDGIVDKQNCASVTVDGMVAFDGLTLFSTFDSLDDAESYYRGLGDCTIELNYDDTKSFMDSTEDEILGKEEARSMLNSFLSSFDDNVKYVTIGISVLAAICALVLLVTVLLKRR